MRERLRIRPLRTRGLVLILALTAAGGCKPKTEGEDESGADLAPRAVDLAAPCPPSPAPGNLLRNPSFEMGSPGAIAQNTGMQPSAIPEWDGCCNLDGQGLTTTWTILGTGSPAAAPRCGQQAVRVVSTDSRGDVLNQSLLITDGAGRNFALTGWARIPEAPTGATSSVLLDIFDLDGLRKVAESAALTTRTDTAQGVAVWAPFSLTGPLPRGNGPNGAPHVQVRVRSTGTVTALIDDLSLTLM